VATSCYNRLSGDIFEALQILKSGYQNGRIQASKQAGAYFALYLEELANLELDGDMPDLKQFIR
jgi:hypothetical protein